MPRRTNTWTLATLFGLLFVLQSHAGTVAVDTNAEGIALQGHDPVAYFTENTAVAGNPELSTEYNGARYLFSNEENLNAFVADPQAYAPQYGGYCAFGTTFQKKIPGDPQAFRVVDGKLYVNSSPDVQQRWSQDIPGNVVKADKAWPIIVDKNPADL